MALAVGLAKLEVEARALGSGPPRAGFVSGAAEWALAIAVVVGAADGVAVRSADCAVTSGPVEIDPGVAASALVDSPVARGFEVCAAEVAEDLGVTDRSAK